MHKLFNNQVEVIGTIFSERYAFNLDVNVNWILEQVDICINKYGIENVLIEEARVEYAKKNYAPYSFRYKYANFPPLPKELQTKLLTTNLHSPSQ